MSFSAIFSSDICFSRPVARLRISWAPFDQSETETRRR
jgi:hypothetical protein